MKSKRARRLPLRSASRRSSSSAARWKPTSPAGTGSRTKRGNCSTRRFLPEFVRESLQGSVSLEWHRLAAETLTAEVRTFPQDDFSFVNTPRHALMMETMQALRFVEDRFRQLIQVTS